MRANGQEERFNRIIRDARSTKCHEENDNTWDAYVGDIELGINITINKLTGKSQLELLFGCRLVSASENVQADILTETSELISRDGLMQLKLNEFVNNRKLQKSNSINIERRQPLIMKVILSALSDLGVILV